MKEPPKCVCGTTMKWCPPSSVECPECGAADGPVDCPEPGWTREPPSEPGWYWAIRESKVVCIHIDYFYEKEGGIGYWYHGRWINMIWLKHSGITHWWSVPETLPPLPESEE